eukprot:9471193-Pyramimonas_sp.AAC.2
MWPRNVSVVCQKLGGHTCGRDHWGFRWGYICGHEACEGVCHMSAVAYAVAANWAFGGAPCATTKRARVEPRSARSHVRARPPDPSVEAPTWQGSA